MKYLTAIMLLFATAQISAQAKFSLFKSSNSIKPDIEKVVQDYFQNFDNIKGDTLTQTVSTIEFDSKIIPTGSLETTITKYKTPKTYSWQCTLFKTEEFKEAVAKYKQYYRQLNGSTFTFSNKTSYRVSGNYDAPDEAMAFASSVLEVNSYDSNLKLFKIEIGLNYAFPEWTVSIMIYEKVADEDIRPSSGYVR